MSYLSGTHGGMYVRENDQSDEDNNLQIFHVRNWQLSTSQSILDATTLGDTDKVGVSGIRTTRGSCQILYYKAASDDKSSISYFAKWLLAGRKKDDEGIQGWECKRPGVGNNDAEPMWLQLYLDTAGSGGVTYTMQVWVTSLSMACSVGDIVSANIQFEQIGAALQKSL